MEISCMNMGSVVRLKVDQPGLSWITSDAADINILIAETAASKGSEANMNQMEIGVSTISGSVGGVHCMVHDKSDQFLHLIFATDPVIDPSGCNIF
jgi:hypothetical protein